MSLDQSSSSVKLPQMQDLPKDFVSFLLAATRNARGDADSEDLYGKHAVLELEVEKFLELECYDPSITPFMQADADEDDVDDEQGDNLDKPTSSKHRVAKILEDVEESRPQTAPEERIKEIESETNKLYKERTSVIEESQVSLSKLTNELSLDDNHSYMKAGVEENEIDYQSRIQSLKRESNTLREKLSTKGALDPSVLELLLANAASSSENK